MKFPTRTKAHAIFLALVLLAGEGIGQGVDSLYQAALSAHGPKAQISLFHQIIKQEPFNVGALNNLGVAFKEQNQLDSALFYLHRAEKLNPIPEVLNNLANVALVQGDTLSARSYYQLAMLRDPSHAYANFNLAKLLWEAGERDSSTQLFLLAAKGEMGAEVSPFLPRQVRVLQHQHRWRSTSQSMVPEAVLPDARGFCRDPRYGPIQLKTVPERQGPWFAFTNASNDTGNVLYFMGRYDEAVAYYQQALEEEPFCLSARVNLGLCFFKQQRYDLCLEDLNESMFWQGIAHEQVVPSHVPDLFLSSFCEDLGEQRQLAFAKVFYDGTQKTGNLGLVHYALGRCRSQVGQEQEALAHYRKALAADPKLAEAADAISSYHYRRGNLEQSLAVLSSVLKPGRKPSQPDLGFGALYNPQAQRSLGPVARAPGLPKLSFAADPEATHHE